MVEAVCKKCGGQIGTLQCGGNLSLFCGDCTKDKQLLESAQLSLESVSPPTKLTFQGVFLNKFSYEELQKIVFLYSERTLL